jgi:hypothetical protein
LLERAQALELIDSVQRNRLWSNASLRGYLAEPHAPGHEQSTTLRCMIECFLRARDLGVEDLGRVFKLGAHDISAWLAASLPPGRNPDQRRDPSPMPAETPCAALVRPLSQRRKLAADRV